VTVSVGHIQGGGVTPIGSILTAATVGQNFDWLSLAVWPRWPRWFLGLWLLSALQFNCWLLTMHTFTEVHVYGRMH